jgi:PadR family transcriptional regulator AphA
MRDTPSIEYVLLGSLMPGPRHGYEIMQFLDSSLDSTWRVGTSQLYALLKRLEQEGRLRSSMETQETRPSKRVFSLTEAGRKGFLDWVTTPTTRIRHFRLEFMSKLFFFYLLHLNGGLELVESQIRVMKRQRDEIEERERREKEPFLKLVYGFKRGTVEGYLRWLSEQGLAFVQRQGI